jgi:hypothetical protein
MDATRRTGYACAQCLRAGPADGPLRGESMRFESHDSNAEKGPLNGGLW